jgi:hypothetical protein
MTTITAKRTLNLIKVPNMAVKDFVYLGSNRSTNASEENEIQRRIGRANTVYFSLLSIMRSAGKFGCFQGHFFNWWKRKFSSMSRQACPLIMFPQRKKMITHWKIIWYWTGEWGNVTVQHGGSWWNWVDKCRGKHSVWCLLCTWRWSHTTPPPPNYFVDSL